MPVPPSAARQPHRVTTHGHTRIDDFFWLRERENPAVIDYLEAENRYAAELTASTAELREQLFGELVARVNETDTTAPVQIGGHLYYSRIEAGRQYRVHCRRSAADAPEQLLLDENRLAEGLAFFSLGMLRVSPDERLLAYTTATTGGEVYDLFVLDLATGELVDRPIRQVGEIEWAGDSRALFYTTHTESWRAFRAYRHTLGLEQRDDRLVYEETDAGLFLHISRSRSGAYLILHSNSAQTAVARVVPLASPEETPRQLTPHTAGISYRAQHHSDEFFVLTNDGAPEYRVLAARLGDPSPAQWREVVPQRPGVSIDAIEVFAEHLAVYEREDGQERLRILELASGVEHTAEFPEAVYTLIGDADDSPWPLNPAFEEQPLRLTYSSLVTPLHVLDYDVAARAFTTVKREQTPGYDPSQYVSERRWATAPDGVKVPISLVRRNDAGPAAPRPCLLVGYGSYGSVEEPSFRATWLPLLERGFVCAIAHIRGGGELGEAWYRQGRVLTKKNTFADFIACAEQLIAEGYTAAELLAIRGRSAGGLLIGAVVTLRPELFRAGLAGVPFVDVINTQLDPSIPLVEQEYEEWGDPRIREHYEYMHSYSPYDNVAAREYPALLVTAGLHDPRVQYWEPAKWVAKLRLHKTGDRPLLLKTVMAGGHYGASGRYEHLREAAFEWAFVLDALGMAPPTPAG